MKCSQIFLLLWPFPEVSFLCEGKTYPSSNKAKVFSCCPGEGSKLVFVPPVIVLQQKKTAVNQHFSYIVRTEVYFSVII